MTDHNLFQEIDEALEHEKLEAMWRRYGPWILAAALVIILGTAGFTSWRSWRTEKNQTATIGLIDITTKPDSDTGKQMAALESYALKNPGVTPAALAQIDAAGMAAKAGNKDRAAQLYDEIAKDARIDLALRQLADLLSIRTQMDTGDPASLEQRLQPLEAENAPWRFSAMELHAYLALRANDKATARRIFTDLSQDARVPQSLSTRATDMLRFISE